MIKGIYSAASGMVPRMLKQETISNNLANVNTPGYKRESVFLRQLNAAEAKAGKTESEWQTPMIDKIYTDFSEGSLEYTGEPLNFAIDGDGFFVVETAQGEAYTRSGNFRINPDGILVTSDGLPVLSDNGQIDASQGELTIDIDGTIRIEGDEFGKLRLVDFEKPYQLEKMSAGVYQPLPDANRSELEFTYIRQGYLEKSNVDIIKEMVDMIASYRNYESDQKAIQILDSTVDKAVNQVGRVK
jgi:flagellar basal-body rod protein FlgF